MKKNKIKSSFSQNLIRIRKEKELSQEKLAELSGLTQRMINYYENEINKSIIDNIEAIAKALNVGINDLLGTKEINKKENEFSLFDSRTIQKLKPLLLLSKDD